MKVEVNVRALTVAVVVWQEQQLEGRFRAAHANLIKNSEAPPHRCS